MCVPTRSVPSSSRRRSRAASSAGCLFLPWQSEVCDKRVILYACMGGIRRRMGRERERAKSAIIFPDSGLHDMIHSIQASRIQNL